MPQGQRARQQQSRAVAGDARQIGDMIEAYAQVTHQGELGFDTDLISTIALFYLLLWDLLLILAKSVLQCVGLLRLQHQCLRRRLKLFCNI